MKAKRERTPEQDQLVMEAHMQTQALQTLRVWLRIAYSAIALGFLLSWWIYMMGGPQQFGWVGIVLLVVGVLCAVPLHIGIKNGQKNVEKMLEVLKEESKK